MRLGLFGGSFDPPHRGHVAVAHAAAEALALERVLWTPVGRQPLKGESVGAAYGDRTAMVGLACEVDPRFVVSGLDGPRADGLPNYTVDTLRRVRAEWPEAEVFALVGMDALGDMARWREADRLPELAEWIAVSRPGYRLPVGKVAVRVLENVHVDVSATEVRERLRLGLDCSGLVPEAVLGYIEERGLYGWSRG